MNGHFCGGFQYGEMARFVIGDVHGCLQTLQRLLERCNWSAEGDEVFLTGDLVNGGPDSAGVLRWAREHAAGVVLGNHDLHLLAVVAGVREQRGFDTFNDVLVAPDREVLLGWLRSRPLLIARDDFVLVHAGLLPEWSLGEACRLAAEVEACVRDSKSDFWGKMYGDEPARWRADLGSVERRRLVVNAMTRMRMLSQDGEIDFEFKKGPGDAPEGLQPWFSAPRAGGVLPRVFFGHWAALGLRVEESVVGMDSGCVWGRELTAFRVEDGAVFQEPSEMRSKGG